MIGPLALVDLRSLTNPNPYLALLHHTPSFQRGYALSRFSNQSTSFGRTLSSGRKTTQETVPFESPEDETSRFTYEEQSSAHLGRG
ncbi:hypothetical protein BDR03DRAFT_646166 [Suillus americanus]|nr:hypothetical protein BDR03DRAFT_646166 [Suillus americanus]